MIATIPFAFTQVQDSTVSLARYLFVVAAYLLQNDDKEKIEICFEGKKVDRAQQLEPGTYVVQISLGVDGEQAQGPHAKTTRFKPFLQGEDETASNSARSSPGGQSHFRQEVFRRDQTCR